MEICEQGFLNLARGVLEQLGMDYKLLWHLKENYDAGNWAIYNADPTRRQNEKSDGLYLVMSGCLHIKKSATGKKQYESITVKQALDDIESYLECHPILGDKKQWIIKQLREECNDPSTKKRVKKHLKRLGMFPKASNM